MKRCSKCKEYKTKDSFHKASKEKSGLLSACKMCQRPLSKNLSNHMKKIHRTQTATSITRKHPAPAYTPIELYNWAISNNYEVLHAAWAASDYNTKLAPSCDRIDDYKPYTLDNLQLVTWAENRANFTLDVTHGINNKVSKEVVQMSLNGEDIRTFPSVSMAARSLGKPHGAIATVCRQKPVKKKRANGQIDYVTPQIAYGYRWRYV